MDGHISRGNLIPLYQLIKKKLNSPSITDNVPYMLKDIFGEVGNLSQSTQLFLHYHFNHQVFIWREKIRLLFTN